MSFSLVCLCTLNVSCPSLSIKPGTQVFFPSWPRTSHRLIWYFHSSVPPCRPPCPHVKDGKQLPASSWISQHSVVFGRLLCLTGLTCRFTHFTVWAETMRKRRQICCRPEPLIQGLTPNAWHMDKVCSLRAHTHMLTLICYREHFIGELCPVTHKTWPRPLDDGLAPLFHLIVEQFNRDRPSLSFSLFMASSKGKVWLLLILKRDSEFRCFSICLTLKAETNFSLWGSFNQQQ